MKRDKYIHRKYWYWPIAELKELIPNNVGALLSVFSSLKTKNFRLYFFGQCISLSGSWIQNVAMSWLVYRLTDSVVILATVTFLNLIPSLVLTPFTGVISDRFNKHKILILTQSLFMAQSLVLAALTLMGVVEVWQVLVLSFFAGVISAVEAPARQSFYTQLVAKSDMTNAIALNSVTINGSRFIGPTIGGIMIGLMGEGYCFLINGISYIAVLVALMMMILPPFIKKVSHNKIWTDLKEGFQYVNGYLPLKVVLIFVAVISFFGMPFMTLVPAVVKEMLGGESAILGYVMSSVGAGAMTAALYLAARKRVKGLGKVVTISGMLFGVGLILLSLVRIPVLAYIVCFPIGFGMIAAAASCNTLLQTLVDDDKRGRVMSFFTMCFVGMNPLGSMVAGTLADSAGIPITLLVSGIVCIAASAIYEYYRPVVRKMARDPYARKHIVPEIARGISDANENPF